MAELAFHVTPCPLQQVEVWADSGREELSRALGFAAPATVGDVAGKGAIRAARLSPRRYWIMGELPLIMIAPEMGTSLCLGQGRLSMTLTPECARRVLPQLMAIDWADPRAAPGRIVLGAIHRVPVAVLPGADGRFELIVPRSFAESIGGLISDLWAA